MTPCADLESQPSWPGYARLMDALLEHLPPPGSNSGWTANLVCEITQKCGPVTVSRSSLSELRRGALEMPSWWTMVALANAFGVCVNFFTSEYHKRYGDLVMRDRVALARRDHLWLHGLAQDIESMPESSRIVVLALIDLLSERGAVRL